jgi:putative ABC transport system permease protein
MWTITLRDLQYRARQFGIAVAGASLVFALTLVLTGISSGFRHEARSTVKAVGADTWIVQKGIPGPFTTQTSMPVTMAAKIADEPGVEQAHPLVRAGQNAKLANGHFKQINVLGHRIGPAGPPDWSAHGTRRERAEVVVDKRLGVGTGETIEIAAKRFRVTGTVEDQTYFAGVPIVWMDLADAQQMTYGGRALTSVVVTKGVPRRLPAGYTALKPGAVRHDLLEPLRGAISAIDILRILMWIVAAVIVGAVVYLSALERVRDFAVLKAVGGSSRDLVISLATEAVITSVGAALIGALVAQVLKPVFPLPVTIETSSYFLLPLIALVVGSVASLAALRRAVAVDPALAFAG